MEKKKKIELAVVFLLFLLLAGYMEFFQPMLEDGIKIRRGESGEGGQEVDLILNAQDVISDYSYALVVEEQKPTFSEAQEYFARAKEEIDGSFCPEGEDVSHVTGQVVICDSYAGGIVTAEWSFDNYHVIDTDGMLLEEGLSEDGTLITAQAELKCDDYMEIYLFPFMAYPRDLTEQESIIKEIQGIIQTQQEQQGQEYLILPEELDGVTLSWKEARRYLVLKVFLLEVLVLLLLPLLELQRRKKETKERNDRLLLDYPDMVSKLAVLVGSGMSVKQAWTRISARYSDKRQKNICPESPVYEEMMRTVRELEDGESERTAYERFGERCGLYSYHRFVRLLVQNLQKGTRGLCDLLEQETETAFEERRILARKLGEEAGTKMLFPLMLMMGIVMAIVLMPAIFEFIG
jgi:hypothetical protein